MPRQKRDAFSERLIRIKRECWQSPWRGARRDADTDLPAKYIRLNALEMRNVVATGGVGISQREALRLGLIDPPEEAVAEEPEPPRAFQAAAGQVPA
jgi:hypothetical protein